MVFYAVLDFCSEILQIFLHLYGDIVRAKMSFMGIGDNRCLTIVCRHDDEAVSGVEDKECRYGLVCWVGDDKLQIVGPHEFGSNGLGCLQVNRICSRLEKQPENDDAK